MGFLNQDISHDLREVPEQSRLVLSRSALINLDCRIQVDRLAEVLCGDELVIQHEVLLRPQAHEVDAIACQGQGKTLFLIGPSSREIGLRLA